MHGNIWACLASDGTPVSWCVSMCLGVHGVFFFVSLPIGVFGFGACQYLGVCGFERQFVDFPCVSTFLIGF